jgi:hypothetical protein
MFSFDFSKKNHQTDQAANLHIILYINNKSDSHQHNFPNETKAKHFCPDLFIS